MMKTWLGLGVLALIFKVTVELNKSNLRGFVVGQGDIRFLWKQYYFFIKF